jgi:hypothetical protein
VQHPHGYDEKFDCAFSIIRSISASFMAKPYAYGVGHLRGQKRAAGRPPCRWVNQKVTRLQGLEGQGRASSPPPVRPHDRPHNDKRGFLAAFKIKTNKNSSAFFQ